MPKIQTSSIFSYRAYPLLSASQIVEGFTSYQVVFVISWLLLNGFTAKDTGRFVQISSAVIGIMLLGFSIACRNFHEAPKCFSVLATYLVHPILLQGIVIVAAPNLSVPTLLIMLVSLV